MSEKTEYGIILLSIVPVRKNESDAGEMVNQLLFGEMIRILEDRGSWLLIESLYDNYQGFIDRKQVVLIPEKVYTKYKIRYADCYVSLSLVHPIHINEQTYHIVSGSSLPDFQQEHKTGKILFRDDEFVFKGRVKKVKQVLNRAEIIQLARKYLATPYLWGGRSPFGIDCSGFTQVVYKMAGIPLLRDASQQAAQGKKIATLSESQKGDLAFFTKKGKQNVSHVGILLNDKTIIHASGQVRIDSIDDTGIYNQELKIYTHYLHSLKSYID